ANPDSNPRTGTIAVADQTHTVTQSAGTCIVELDPLSAKADAAGGSDAISLTSGCAWAAASKAAWITVTPASGTGKATLTWTAAPNSVPKARSGTIVAGSKTFAILQAAAPCNLSLSGDAAAVGSNGGNGTIQVTAAAGCEWSPGSNVSWIKFTWASVNGSGNVNYAVEPNPGVAPRAGVLTIGGQRFTVTQDAPRFRLASSAVVAHAASLIAGPVSPGLIVTLFVPGAGPAVPATAQLTADRRAIATSLGETRVVFNGVAAPMVYASDSQISAIVPYQVAAAASAEMFLEFRGERSNVVSVPVAAAAPGIFTANSSGTGPAVVLNQNLSLNTAANPAARNSLIVFYASGEGQTNPMGADGRLAPTTATGLARPVLPVVVLMDGQEAQIAYAGAAPGQVAGLLQVNARVPAGATPGNVSLVLRVGQFESRPGVTFWVQ
ncbi:MAG: BACON domain-containing protein, partial [Bryobacteraceae bacterium]